MANLVLTEHAPAKINLALHVTGQRDDGYHMLDSLVVFSRFGDQISGYISDENGFVMTGPFAAEFDHSDHSDNLIIKARNALADYANQKGLSISPVHLTCEKNIPIASGLGGGSADAAATLRLLIDLWKLDIPSSDLSDMAIKLGADVPMCLLSNPLIARGIGEDITAINIGADCHMIIANPLVAVSTPQVFDQLKSKHNSALTCALDITQQAQLIDILANARNDLEVPAKILLPEIQICIDALLKTKPLFARMSGSGASCFALYHDQDQMDFALKTLQQNLPNWFFTATELKEPV
jgi:4-diphosphocytidyl-2-C-methyl-D-erythritol kinase